MVLKEGWAQIPETCEYVTLLGKEDFEDVRKLWCLRWGGYTEWPRWAQRSHKDPKEMQKARQEEQGQSVRDATRPDLKIGEEG